MNHRRSSIAALVLLCTLLASAFGTVAAQPSLTSAPLQPAADPVAPATPELSLSGAHTVHGRVLTDGRAAAGGLVVQALSQDRIWQIAPITSSGFYILHDLQTGFYTLRVVDAQGQPLKVHGKTTLDLTTAAHDTKVTLNVDRQTATTGSAPSALASADTTAGATPDTASCVDPAAGTGKIKGSLSAGGQPVA